MPFFLPLAAIGEAERFTHVVRTGERANLRNGKFSAGSRGPLASLALLPTWLLSVFLPRNSLFLQ